MPKVRYPRRCELFVAWSGGSSLFHRAACTETSSGISLGEQPRDRRVPFQTRHNGEQPPCLPRGVGSSEGCLASLARGARSATAPVGQLLRPALAEQLVRHSGKGLRGSHHAGVAPAGTA